MAKTPFPGFIISVLQGKLEFVENIFFNMDLDGDGEVSLQGYKLILNLIF